MHINCRFGSDKLQGLFESQNGEIRLEPVMKGDVPPVSTFWVEKDFKLPMRKTECIFLSRNRNIKRTGQSCLEYDSSLNGSQYNRLSMITLLITEVENIDYLLFKKIT